MISYRDSAQATNATTTTTISIAIPAAAQLNDLAVLAFVAGDYTFTHTLDAAGWTKQIDAPGSATNNLAMIVWSKILTATDLGTTLTVTSSSSPPTKRTLDIVIYSGAQIGNTAHAYETIAGTTHITPAVTTVSSTAWIAQYVADRASPGSASFTYPSNLTQRQFFAHLSGGAPTSIYIDDDVVGSGAVGVHSYTGTVSTRNVSMATLAIEPYTPILAANAGSDATHASAATVVLSGGATGGSGSYSYNWSQIGGSPAVVLSGATTPSASFTAPTVATNTIFTFQLSVDDGVSSATDTVAITITPPPSGSFFVEGFSGGSNGQTVSTGNSGFSAIYGAPTFDGVYENAIATTSGKCDAGPSATFTALQKNFTSTVDDFWARWYSKVGMLPPTPTFIGTVLNGTTIVAQIRLNIDGTLSIRNGTVAVATSITNITPNRFFRLSWHVNAAGTTQALRIYTGTNLHGTTPTETISGVFNAGLPNRMQFGVTGSPVASFVIWVDAIELNYSVDPGPASNTNLFVYVDSQAGIEPGSNVSLTASAVGGLPPYSFAWTQTNGEAVALLQPATPTTTFIAPGVSGGTAIELQCDVLDSGGTNKYALATASILTALEWAAKSGAWMYRRPHSAYNSDWHQG